MSQPEMRVGPTGTKRWYLDGKFHREDGPAIVYEDGQKQWYLRGNLHREDGPAIVYPDGQKEWYLNNRRVTWQELYRQANNPEIELRILTAALTFS
jgi:hypothetical protein